MTLAQDELELWGGPECTINRVGDRYADQFARNGHDVRESDLDRFAELGIRAIRYPVAWERIAPDHPERCDWTWADARLNGLRERGIRVIAGLVHHGSGPRYTNLLDDTGFATGLAEHARKVARRYPWITDWTPVNEPLTTARFSALYGHWYPHARDEGAFWRALLNQIDGVRLAMAAVREVNPHARLIQTDDLGRTYATAAVRGQAAFDNLRRWAGWDLLCGRVTAHHPLWRHIAKFGLADRLQAIAEAPCPPDVIGLNHYLTSDRFLDHRLERYPGHVHGGNGRQRYADVEAIRVLEPPPPGLCGVIEEAWERYRIPIAVTEVHNGCTREEQLRWLAEAWDTAKALRAKGVAVEAITVWSLLGSADWNTLLTGPGVYEPGVYDVRSGTARPTALARLMQALPVDGPRDPLVQAAGWWRRPVRLEHPVVNRPASLEAHVAVERPEPRKTLAPMLICGATGTLGQAIARACALRNIPHVLTRRGELDLSDAGSIAAALDRHAPWAVVNAAGWVRVDDAEDEAAACFAANADGGIRLSAAASERGIPSVNFSSDLVFGGREAAYLESDTTAARNVYGASKAAMEAGVAALDGNHLVVRTAAFFSPFDNHNFAIAVARELSAGRRFEAAEDLVVSPTYVPHLVDATLDLLIDGETGLWHLTNGTALSWADFARQVARAAGLAESGVTGVPAEQLGFRAERPGRVALESAHGAMLPSLDRALADFAAGLRWDMVRARHCA